MKLAPVDAADARAVLRGLRGAVLGAGPAIACGAAGATTTPPAEEVPSGTAVVVTTSGSTGYPKSVVLSRSALTSSALATAERIGEGSWLLALPAGYIAGIQVLVRALVAGHEPALLQGAFSAHTFAAAAGAMASSVGGHRVAQFTSLVPAQVATLLDSPEGTRALASFDTVLVGGQAISPALRERAADAGARLVRTYGSSETAGGCVYDGTPLSGVDVRIDDGEILVAGPMLADGYLGDPDRTAAAFTVDAHGRRWFSTGDAGTFAGILQVIGRRDNVIVSGGINVSLDRVEHLARTIPGLEGAVVVAADSTRWGQVPVIVAAVSDVDAAGLLARARALAESELGVAGRPARLDTVETIPLGASGKPDRRALLPRPPAH